MSDWGQGAKNNNIGWGQGAANNNIGWGNSHKVSWAGDTEIVGTDGAAPVNTIAPVISGTATIGQTLTSTSGTWTSDTGITGYLYQWYRGATLITGAVSSTYVLTLSDVGFYITCRVAATDTDGTSAYVSSSNSIFLFDADYQDVLTRANNLGYSTPSSAQQIVQNKLVLDLKAGGVWSELDVFYVFATGTGATNAFASLNWKAPASYQATLNNPLAFATNNGLTASGTGNVSTNFIPSNGINKYLLNNASRFAWVHTAGTGTIDGVGGSVSNRFTFDGTLTQNINNGTTSNAQGALSGTGLKSINRPASNQIRVFENTNLSVSGTSNSSSLIAAAQLVFRSSGAYGTHTISIYGMGASLVTSGGDATLNTNLYNAINTYMTNLV